MVCLKAASSCRNRASIFILEREIWKAPKGFRIVAGLMPNSVPVDARVLMVVLPIEPVILQRIDPRETLTLHIAGKRTTVKSPLAQGHGIE